MFFWKKKKILVTHPGKIGDLLYSLNAIRALSEHFNTPVHILTSSYCRGLSSLLKTQTYIAEVIIDEKYKPDNQNRGLQPNSLSIPKGFKEIFELGYREQDSFPITEKPLSEYSFFALKEFYGLDLTRGEAPRLQLIEGRKLPISSPYFIFQCLGETLDIVLHPAEVNRIATRWSALVKSFGIEAIVLTGEREVARYKALGWKPIIPKDLLESAHYLVQSKGVIAPQSALLALANELGVPRIHLDFFKNAPPDTPGALKIPFAERSLSSAFAAREWVVKQSTVQQ